VTEILILADLLAGTAVLAWWHGRRDPYRADRRRARRELRKDR
jgi:hypothetical protein